MQNEPQVYDMEMIEREYRALESTHPVRQVLPTTQRLLATIGEEKLKPARAIPTPFEQLNRACRGTAGGMGLPYRSHILLMARSGGRKSLLAQHFVDAATAGGVNTAVINLEMDASETYTRLLALSTQTPARFLEHGRDFRRGAWDAAARQFCRRPGQLWMNPEPTIFELGDILKAMRVLNAKFGVDLFILDYIQLVRVRGAKDRREEVEAASRGLDRLMKEIDATCISLAQLNREAAKNFYDTPSPEQAQWSSALEQDARMVLIIDHSRQEDQANGPMTCRVVLTVGKNRSGPAPDIILDWDYVYLRATEAPRGLEWDADARRFVAQQVDYSSAA